MNNLKKRTISLLILAAVFTASLFSQNWYVCLGSFKNEANAFQRIELLENKGISVCYSEFKKSDTEILYRILLDEAFENLNDAHGKITALNENPAVSELGITGIWCCQAENTKKIRKINPEKRLILVQDSDTGAPVPDADVKFDEKWQTKTSKEGKALLPKQIKDGEHQVEVTKGNEYVPTTSTIKIENDEIVTSNQITIPKKVTYDRIKIILDWKDYPEDLDAHILLNNYHVYYSNKIDANLILDLDETEGYGPETITIMNPKASDLYRFYVYNFSDDYPEDGTSLSNSGAAVKVYFGNELKQTFTIEPGKNGILWHVFDIENNEIVVKNQMLNKYRSMFNTENSENEISDNQETTETENLESEEEEDSENNLGESEELDSEDEATEEDGDEASAEDEETQNEDSDETESEGSENSETEE